jgi:uncharacterized repeat protein (TIGR03803 family)
MPGWCSKWTPVAPRPSCTALLEARTGIIPIGGLLRDKAGNLYGTTSQGGSSNDGVLFKISPRGKETILHTLTGSTKDGKYPSYTNLLMDAQGNLYGVTEEGGKADGGILYKLSKRQIDHPAQLLWGND